MKGSCKVRDGVVQNKNVNDAAITARETPACAARVDTAPTTNPPAELVDVLEAAAAVPDEEPDRDEVDRVFNVVPVVVLEVEVEVVREEVVLLADVDETELVLLLPPWRYDGAGVPEDGLVSPPNPQGIACPSGWVAFGGGTVAPVGSAMANRPVHVSFVGAAGVLNW